jgi:signal transduction histidine kinase
LPDYHIDKIQAAYFEIENGKISNMNPAGEIFLQEGIEAGIKNFKKYLVETIESKTNIIRIQHRHFGIKVIGKGEITRVLIIDLEEFRPNLEELFDISSFQHEMKNPLTVIDGTSQIILAKTSDEYLKKCATIIQNETERIKHILQNIKLLSEMELEIITFTVKDFIEELKDSLQVLFPDINLLAQLEPELTIITADRKKLFMAINNIIKNACEAQQSGNIFLNISIDPTIKYLDKETGEPFPMVKITISDNGPGIEQKVLSKLFTPFFTTKNRGTGLGLVIAKEITEKHRGRIEVQSIPGAGTSFILCIPLKIKSPYS